MKLGRPRPCSTLLGEKCVLVGVESGVLRFRWAGCVALRRQDSAIKSMIAPLIKMMPMHVRVPQDLKIQPLGGVAWLNFRLNRPRGCRIGPRWWGYDSDRLGAGFFLSLGSRFFSVFALF